MTIVVHEICTINGLSNANEDCVVSAKGNTSLDQPFSSILMQDCAVEAGKQRRRFEPVIDSDLS